MASRRKDIERRRQAEKESSLPYSFKYKVVKAFWGKPCPVCGIKMCNVIDDDLRIAGTYFIPTIQHNKPLVKGGKHELGNISVICKRCNLSIGQKETGELNAKEVTEFWLKNGCSRKG